VLSAIFRVGPYSQATGAPCEYALRLLVEPASAAATADNTQTAWPARENTRTA
jgi:hypothetical protein